jgi:hypothetical protein
MSKRTKIKRLSDSYRFPGFRPSVMVTGVFGDPHARTIRQHRRSKKARAGLVAVFAAAGTTGGHVAYGICPAVARGSILRLTSAASIAGDAGA